MTHLEASSKMLLGTPEDVPADESAAEFQEWFANVSSTIEAYAKTTEVAGPRVSPFDDPTEFAQTPLTRPTGALHGLFPRGCTMWLVVLIGH
jgi:hypothetical protein